MKQTNIKHFLSLVESAFEESVTDWYGWQNKIHSQELSMISKSTLHGSGIQIII